MIREYALDPSVIVQDSNILQRVFSEFGAENGRVIADTPHKWTECVKRMVQKLGFSPMEKRDCFDELERLKRTGIVKRDGRGLGDDTWLNKCLELNVDESFQAILTDNAVVDSNQYNYLNMLGNKPNDWLIEQTQSVPRNAAELSESISHSLLLSKQFIFVDPYFNPLKDDSRLPFLAYINIIASGRFSSKKVFIHTCEQPSADLAKRKIRTDLQRGMLDCIQPLLPEGFTVELWIWPNDKLHDRFILSNLVGHAFGHGLDETQYREAINVNVNRLGATSRASEFRKFSTKAHILGDSISVTG